MDLEVKDGFCRQHMEAHAHRALLAPLVGRWCGERTSRGNLQIRTNVLERYMRRVYDGFEQDESEAKDETEDGIEEGLEAAIDLE
jgi:hypothetical protein